MQTFTKKYILATYSDGGYQLKEFDSVSEAVLEDHYSSDWCILTPVTIKIEEHYEK